MCLSLARQRARAAQCHRARRGDLYDFQPGAGGPARAGPLAGRPTAARGLRTLEELGAVPFRDRIRDYEVKLLTDALDAAGGNQSRAAEILRMPLRTLVHKIRTYGLKKTYKRDDE